MSKQENRFKEITKLMEETYIKKNKDYGNSIGDTFKKYGDVSFLTRVTDKINRLDSLLINNNKQEVSDEKIEDTILDCANYLILWQMEREKLKTCTKHDDSVD